MQDSPQARLTPILVLLYDQQVASVREGLQSETSSRATPSTLQHQSTNQEEVHVQHYFQPSTVGGAFLLLVLGHQMTGPSSLQQ